MLREILSPEAPLFHPGNPKENAYHPQPSTPNPRVKLAVSQLLFGLSMPVCWGWGAHRARNKQKIWANDSLPNALRKGATQGMQNMLGLERGPQVKKGISLANGEDRS